MYYYNYSSHRRRIKMKGTFHFLLVILISLVQCSENSKKYEDYANQFFNHEKYISMKDELGKEYIFESWIIPSDTCTIYRNYETEEPSNYIYKIELEPGYVGIRYCSENGTIREIQKNAQPILLNHAKITKGSTIIKIDSLDFNNELLHSKADGWEKYTIEVMVPQRKNLIQFEVVTTNAKKNGNKTLHIKFTKLCIAPKNSILKNTEYFLKIFENIYEYSPYDTTLKIEDVYNHQSFNTLKFTYFFKYGKTFFEQFNFHYIVKIPDSIRETKNNKLNFEDLKKIKEKYTKIGMPETISDLVTQIESNYFEMEAEAIFVDIFYTHFQFLFDNFPTDMVYRSPKIRKYRPTNNFEELENPKKNNVLLKLFSKLKKGTESEYLLSREDPDNFL